MKIKRFLMALVATIAISTMAMAQQPAETMRGKHDPVKMAKHRTEKMVKKYGLNDEQAEKLLVLNTKYAGKLRLGHRHHGRHLDGEGVRPDDDQRKVMEAYDTELQTIMTAEQFAEYKKADHKKRPRRGHDEGCCAKKCCDDGGCAMKCCDEGGCAKKCCKKE